jgi:glucose-6-phosphate isomerase
MHVDTQRMNIDNDTYEAIAAKLGEYRVELVNTLQSSGYAGSQDSIKLSADQVIRSQAQDIQAQFPEIQLVVVIGIGGSNLGTKAVYEALELPVQMEFIDTVDPLTIDRVWEMISQHQSNEVVVCAVSKSGSTAETIANAEIILERMKEEWGQDEAINRTIIISDAESPLYQCAQAAGHIVVAHEKIGGRYSVFSSVGLVPLALAGCDISSLHEGARSVVNTINTESEMANERAIGWYAQYQAGRSIHNIFVFNPELASLGAWYRQLVGESLGKKHNRDNEEVHTGMIPTVAVGSTDLHSMAQLYLSDPGLISTTFIYSPREGIELPADRAFADVVPMITGETTTSIMDAIYQGTTTAYTNSAIPFSEIRLDAVSAYEVGALLQMHMIEVMYLAYLMQVDAFDQPSVEEYKKETKRILEK